MKGHIRKRGKDSWAIVIDLGRDSTGKRRQKWHTVRGTKKNAQRELTRLLNAFHTGEYVEPSRMTVADYLARWLQDYAKINISAKTYERYDEIVEGHLVPSLGRNTLAKLQPLHIQSYYSDALQNGRKNGKGGLSPQTVLHHHRLLRAALQQAVKWQMLARNPADAVEPPRSRRPEMKVLNEAETALLLKGARQSQLHVPVLLAVTTGMRRGEILGLRWKDIDLKAGTLAVRQSLEQTKNGLTFKKPKTNKDRTVALPRMTVEGLRRHRAQQAEERLQIGPAYMDQDLVCCRPEGQPFRPDSMSNAFRALVKATGLPAIRFHDLRHTHATQLLQQGVHPKIVSERLGHSTVGITLDTYSHVLPGMQEEAARRVDEALRAALGTSQEA